jgi:F-type H+-transporting ATPase subunit b
MNPIINTLLVMLVGSSVFAAGAHHGDGVPTVVYWQAANLAILFTGLYLLTRKKVKSFFTSKREDFLTAANKSKKVREDAEAKVNEINGRLQKLEASAAESVERARAESADLKRQLIAEANTLANRIKSEATEAAKSEALRAQRELHKTVALEAVSLAKEVLKKDTSQSDQAKLQDQFAKQFDGVKL